jgi:KaiC/GvpD/RAD55 family RecA-like ATPase
MPGGVYVLAGLTGNGKSSTASNLARLCAKTGKRVLLISLEDDRLAVGRRLLAQEARVAIKALENFKKPGAVTASELTKVDEARGRLRGLPLRIESLVSDLKQVEALIEREAADGTKLVILDQSSWITVEGAENPFQEASQISRSLKMLAKRMGVVLLVLVQVNRGGAANRANGQDIELNHIRDSGRWEQDADGVLIIQRIDDSTDPALMTVDLKKHRHGPKEQRITLAFTLRTGLIEDDPKALKPGKIEGPTGATAKEATRTAKAMTTEAFVERLVAPFPRSRNQIQYEAEKLGIKPYKANQLLQQAAAVGLALAVEIGPHKERGYQLARTGPVAPIMSSTPAITA